MNIRTCEYTVSDEKCRESSAWGHKGRYGEQSVMEGLALRHLSRVLRDLEVTCMLEKESAPCRGKNKYKCLEKRGRRKEG